MIAIPIELLRRTITELEDASDFVAGEHILETIRQLKAALYHQTGEME